MPEIDIPTPPPIFGGGFHPLTAAEKAELREGIPEPIIGPDMAAKPDSTPKAGEPTTVPANIAKAINNQARPKRKPGRPKKSAPVSDVVSAESVSQAPTPSQPEPNSEFTQLVYDLARHVVKTNQVIQQNNQYWLLTATARGGFDPDHTSKLEERCRKAGLI